MLLLLFVSFFKHTALTLFLFESQHIGKEEPQKHMFRALNLGPKGAQGPKGRVDVHWDRSFAQKTVVTLYYYKYKYMI